MLRWGKLLGGGGDAETEKNTNGGVGNDAATESTPTATAAASDPPEATADAPETAIPTTTPRGENSSDGPSNVGVWALDAVLAGGASSRSGRQSNDKKSNKREIRPQPQARDEDASDGDMTRVNSSGSGTASTKSVSSDSLSNSPEMDSAKAAKKLVQRQKQERAPSSNGPPAAATFPSPRKSPTDDDQTIARLESECVRISLSMSRIKKYTHEWFALESRLNNAKDELDAAKEDRDMHFYVGGGESPMEVGSLGLKLDEPDGKRRSEVSSDAAIAPNDNVGDRGIEIPGTVVFGDVKGAKAAKESEKVVPSPLRPAHIDVLMRHELKRKEEELENLPKFSEEWFDLKDELVQLRIALDEGPEQIPSPQLSPQLPPQKEPKEIEAVSIPSIKRKEPDRLFSRDRDEEKGGSRKKDSAKERKKKKRKELKKAPKKEKERKEPPLSPQFRPVSSRGPARSPRSPSPMPRGSLSPHPTSSGSGGVTSPQGSCLSPYHSVSSGGGNATHRGNAPQNIYQMVIGGRSLDDEDPTSQEYQMSIAIEDLLQKRDQACKDLERATTYSKEWFELKTNIVELEDRIEELENDSSEGSISYLPNQDRSLISGWSSVMSESEEEVLSLADDLDCALVAEALKRQHECEDGERVLSIDDEAEAQLLKTPQEEKAEMEMRQAKMEHLVTIQALVRGWMQLRKYKRQRARATKIQALVRGRQQLCEYAAQRKVNSSAATLIQTLVRKGHAKSKYRCTLLAVVRLQCGWRRYSAKKTVEAARAERARLERIAKEREARLKAEASEFDLMLDDLAMMIGEGDDDDAERDAFNAMMIEACWSTYIACKPVIGLRKKAQAYRGLKRDEALLHNRFKIFSALDRGDKQEEEEKERVTWHKFAAVYIQAVWRKCLALQHFQQQRACAAKIQALVRGRLISRRHAQRREKAVVIQSFVRQKLALSKLKQAQLAIAAIQRLWRKALSAMPWIFVRKHASKVQALVRSRQQQRHYHRQHEKAVIIQTFLRTIWVATGQLYTDQRTVTFYSADLGVELGRGKDGFVRVLSTSTYEATAHVISSLVLDGTSIEPGDLVLKAAGVNLKSPITVDGWKDTVQKINDRPRPMMMLVASGTRRIKNQLADECKSVSLQLRSVVSAVKIQRIWRASALVVKTRADRVRASMIIQACVRKWMARCLVARKLERDVLLAEFDAILLQLGRLQAAVVLQSHARGLAARSSFCRQRGASTRIQAVARMSASRREYTQTLARVFLIQSFIRGVLSVRSQAATLLQAHARGFVARSSFSRQQESSIRIQALARTTAQSRRYKRTLADVVILQSLARRWGAQSELFCQRYAIRRIQTVVRTNVQRRKYCQILTRVMLIQRFAKSWLSGRSQAATVLQSHVRGFAARSLFCRQKQASIRIQALARMDASKKEYMQLRKSVVLIHSVVYRWCILRNYAAVVMQSLARRYLVRKNPPKRLTRFELLRLRAEQQSSGARPAQRGHRSNTRAKPKPVRNYALLRQQLEHADQKRERRGQESESGVDSRTEGNQEREERSGTTAISSEEHVNLHEQARERQHRPETPISRERVKSAAEIAALREQLLEQAKKNRQLQATTESNSHAPKPPGRFELLMRKKLESKRQLHVPSGSKQNTGGEEDTHKQHHGHRRHHHHHHRHHAKSTASPQAAMNNASHEHDNGAASTSNIAAVLEAANVIRKQQGGSLRAPSVEQTASAQEARSTSNAPSSQGAKQPSQAGPPGRFERLMRKQKQTTAQERQLGGPSVAPATSQHQAQSTSRAPSSQGAKQPSQAGSTTGRFELLMQKQLSAQERQLGGPVVAPTAPQRESQSPRQPSTPEGAKPLPQARPPGRFELMMNKQRSSQSNVDAPHQTHPHNDGAVHKNREAFEHPHHTHMKRSEHGEKWDPEKEIDAVRVDSIKAMWGQKAARSQPKVPTFTRAGMTSKKLQSKKEPKV